MSILNSVNRTLVVATILGTVSCSEPTPRSPLAPGAVETAAAAGSPNADPASVTPAALGMSPERADVMNQGGAGIYAAAGALVVRQPKGLRLSMTMPTPEPGSYVYPPNPPGIVPGHPEVFTLWAFIFNYPALCDGPCDGNDIGANAAAKGSVYNVGGHVASGESLTIAGRIGIGEPAVAPAGITPTPLVNPSGAEIHLAITSHGMLDPARLPTEFHVPTGSPACGCWWVAIVPAP